MVNGFCFGGAFTQVSACDFAIAADEAQFGLSEVNWGILPGGIVSWNVVQMMNFRDAMYYAMTGDTFDGKKAKEIGFVNMHFPKAKLKEETDQVRQEADGEEPGGAALHQGGDPRGALHERAAGGDYLMAKSDALKLNDKEGGRQQGMKQFLDDKTYRPGFGHFKRKKAAAK